LVGDGEAATVRVRVGHGFPPNRWRDFIGRDSSPKGRESPHIMSRSGALYGVGVPPGVVMVSPLTILRNASRAQSEGPHQVRRRPSAAQDSIVAGVLHLASLQRGSLILREDCYNVVTRAPTVGNDSVVSDSKRERGVHARYALLLGTRRAGGGRRPDDRLGAVPVGPPLALAARCGPGLTH
jgi:hypothetical protein